MIFFARYEASQFGSATIESEHFLLGLIREDKELASEASFPIPHQSKHLASRSKTNSGSVKRYRHPSIFRCLTNANAFSATPTKKPKDSASNRIDTSHLLLGILREENCVAAKVLNGLGLELKAVREEVRRRPPLTGRNLARALGISGAFFIRGNAAAGAGVVPDADTAKRIAEAVWIPRSPACPMIESLRSQRDVDVLTSGSSRDSHQRR